MSVWDHAHYRDDALQWGLRSVPNAFRDNPFFHSLADFIVEDFGEFPVPDGIEPGNLKANAKGDPAVYSKVDHNFKYSLSDEVGRAIVDLPPCKFGISAVYEVASTIIRKSKDGSGEVTEKQKGNHKFYKRLVQYGFAAGNHSARDVEARAWAIHEATEGDYNQAQLYIQDLLRFRGYSKSKSSKAAVFRAKAGQEGYPAVETRALGKFRGFEVYAFPGATVIKPVIGYKCWLLTAADVERVEHLVRGVMSARVYGTFYGALNNGGSLTSAGRHAGYSVRYRPGGQRGRLLEAIDRMTDLIVGVTGNVDIWKANHLCRAFDVAYSMYVAKYIVRDDPRALKEQLSKWNDEKLDDVVKYSDIHATVRGFREKEAMEVLLMYKALPQPDFDYFGAAKRQQDMYQENQDQAREDGAAEGIIFENVMNYHKLLIIKAFYKRHKRLPGTIRELIPRKAWHDRYPHVNPKSLTPGDALDIDLGGEYIWLERGNDVLDVIKDKAICPKNIDSVEDIRDIRKLHIKERNYLLDVIMRDCPVDARIMMERFRDNKLFLDVRSDDKAEAKKPDQRWFFELHSDARMILSIYEESITQYAVHVPGCFSGKSHADKVDAMNKITRPVSAVLPFRVLQVSFDIKKFSPYLPARVHRALDVQWAEAFGIPALVDMSKIITEGNIHYVKGCIHHQFKKVGVDFEGFFGKKLTVYHCAVMGYCVNRLRQDKIVTQAGKFAALIDDGLLRIDLRRADYDVSKAKALEVIEDTYAKAALRISWDKTYVSEFYATFLHEVRDAGRSITAGMRAAIKINSRSDGPADCLVDDLAKAAATAFGAISSGAPQVATYMMYLLNVVEAMNRWDRQKDVIFRKDETGFSQKEAIRCFLPQTSGGMGLESIITISGSLKGPTLIESLGICELIGYRYPEVRPVVNKILNADHIVPSEESRISNPGYIVTRDRRLRNDRFTNMMERSLIDRSDSPALSALLGAKTIVLDGITATYADLGSKLPLPLRELFDASDRVKVVRKLASKFLTARSAIALIKYHKIIRVQVKNRSEAVAYLESYHD